MTEPRDRAILETAIRHLRKHDLLCFDNETDGLGDDPQDRLVGLLAALLTPTGPRSWSLPPEPPEDVRKVRGHHPQTGQPVVLQRALPMPADCPSHWVGPPGSGWRSGETRYQGDWGETVFWFSGWRGPLTEVVDSEPEPYRCEGCGKTSRIAAHESWCPVYATPLRSARRDRG